MISFSHQSRKPFYHLVTFQKENAKISKNTLNSHDWRWILGLLQHFRDGNMTVLTHYWPCSILNANDEDDENDDCGESTPARTEAHCHLPNSSPRICQEPEEQKYSFPADFFETDGSVKQNEQITNMPAVSLTLASATRTQQHLVCNYFSWMRIAVTLNNSISAFP